MNSNWNLILVTVDCVWPFGQLRKGLSDVLWVAQRLKSIARPWV